MPSDAPAILAFYRADASRTIRRVLGVGAALVTTGALVMVVSFLTRVAPDWRMGAATLGVACVIAGGLTTVIGMQRALADDACVVVRSDGISLQLRGIETLVVWPDIAVVRAVAAPPQIVIERRAGDDVVIADRTFGGKDARALAATLDDARRKASFDLLRG